MMLHSKKSRATSALLAWYISYSSSFLLLFFLTFLSFTPFYLPCNNVFSVFPSRVSNFCRIRPSAMVFVSVSPCFHSSSSFLFSTSSSALIFFLMYSFFAFRIIFFYIRRKNVVYATRVQFNSLRSNSFVLSQMTSFLTSSQLVHFFNIVFLFDFYIRFPFFSPFIHNPSSLVFFFWMYNTKTTYTFVFHIQFTNWSAI